MEHQLVEKGSVRLFHHELAMKIGLNEAIVLQQFDYWLQVSKHEKQGRKWVFNTYEGWHEQFPYWSFSTLKRTIRRLEEMGLLLTGRFNKMKTDRTKWYSIDYERCEELLGEEDEHQPQVDETLPVDSAEGAKTAGELSFVSLWTAEEDEEVDTISSERNIDFVHDDLTIPKITQKSILKNEKNIQKSAIVTEVIAYLNDKTNSCFRPTNRKNRDVIIARLNEGYSLEDFKKVIDVKTEHWLADSYWSRYLRPATLFGTKFESYLNQRISPGTGRLREEDFDFDDEA